MLTSTNSPFPVSTNTTTTAETETGLEKGEERETETDQEMVFSRDSVRCMILWQREMTVERSHGYNTDAEEGFGA